MYIKCTNGADSYPCILTLPRRSYHWIHCGHTLCSVNGCAHIIQFDYCKQRKLIIYMSTIILCILLSSYMGESCMPWENVPQVNLHQYNQINVYPKLNSYRCEKNFDILQFHTQYLFNIILFIHCSGPLLSSELSQAICRPIHAMTL